MKPLNEQAVKAYMRSVMHEHLYDGGDVNMTALAEDACNFFEAFGPAPTYDCPEIIFEWAYEIADA